MIPNLQEFERWITSKERALEAETDRRKAAEYKLEEVTIKKIDLVKISKSQGVMLKQAKEDLVRKVFNFGKSGQVKSTQPSVVWVWVFLI